MYKHIVWDFDGTLFDSYPVMGFAFQKALEEEGIIENLDEIMRHMKVTMQHAIEIYKEKYRLKDSFFERANKIYMEMGVEQYKPYTGIEDICKEISEAGKFNYLYTHRGESAIQILKFYNLYEYFKDCIISTHGFERKPSPQALNHLIEKHQIDYKEAIMIGDRDLDIMAGKNAGISSCYFDDTGKVCQISDYNISEFKQLYDILF